MARPLHAALLRVSDLRFFLQDALMMINFTKKAKRYLLKSLASTVHAEREHYVVTCRFALTCTTCTRHRPVASLSKGNPHAVQNFIAVS